MLQLYVKRAKIFMDGDSGKERRCTLPMAKGPQPAPDWVRHASGFKEGLADGSIIDLTPPTVAAAVEETENDGANQVEEEAKAAKVSAKARTPKGTVTASVVNN